MSGVILDASALLAFLQDEPGSALVEGLLTEAEISAVNWAEVVQRARARGVDCAGLRWDMEALGLRFVACTPEQGERAGLLWERTQSAGLSLGDRACLALAAERGLPALTADRAWARAESGVEVRLIR